MNRRHLRSDFLDWIDRNADLFPLVGLVAVLFTVVAMCAGSEDDNTGHKIATTPPPAAVVAVPGSLTHGNAQVEPGAAGTEGP